jgi:hypothetical protein
MGSIAVRLARAPALWLVLVVGVSTAVRGVIAAGVPSPWILPDEVVYSEVAKSIAAGGFPAVRGVHELGWGVVYQAIIAPAWAALADPVQAYHAALVINAFVMSLAAVPAYLLARMFLSRGSSMVVAVMTVLVPSMAYTGVVMTENACYPAFLLAVLLLARAVRSPTVANQAFALVGLGVVVLTRIQAMALVAAYVGAILLYAWVGAHSQRRNYVRRFVPTFVVVALLSFAPMILSVVRGDGAFGWLGTRSDTFEGLHVHEIPQWFVFLTADLILYVAVAPAAATAIVLGLGLSRRSSESLRLFSAVALPSFVAMLGSVSIVSASLDVDGTENLNERYVFYVVPLLFVGLALWIREGLPRPRPWAAVIAGICCLLPALLPIGRLAYNASFQSVALVPWLEVDASDAVIAALVAGFTLLCAALWLTASRGRIGYLWLAPALWMTTVGAIVVISNANSASNFAAAFSDRHANWVDRAIPSSTDVAILWDERQAPARQPDMFSFWLMVTELFNEKVGTVYRVGPPTYYETFLPTVPVTTRSDGSVVDETGRTIESRYVLSPCLAPVEGETVALSPRGALRLVATHGPVRLLSSGRCGRETP